MQPIHPLDWKKDMPEFKEKTRSFYAGEMEKAAYKGFSGLYGSYAQKDGKSSMLRLRMTAGRVTQEKLSFVANALEKYPVPRLHFTTCQSIQFHDLDGETTCAVMEEALDAGIVTMGGGGDFPRNVMCSPLSGVEKEEYFDVTPWAEAAAEYLMHFIKAEKMPRKLKVGFSNSPANLTHATFRDLGFAARTDGNFDVYSAGGLGNNPMLGVKVAEKVAPEKIGYYIKAMWLTFRAYGNFENRGKARTRYMQETLGGAENYKKAYLEKLEEVMASGENLDFAISAPVPAKCGNGESIDHPRAIAQKQKGLYAVSWHPLGGQPSKESFIKVARAVVDIPGAEMRLAPDQGAYIVNLNAKEAKDILALTEDGAQTVFETSVSCIGGATCQVGIRDSQGLLKKCMKAVREAKIPDGALPKMYISGCPSSCGTHQAGIMGFRGGTKAVDGKPQSAFTLFADGVEKQGAEQLAHEVGAMLEEDIPAFLVKLGKAVTESGMDFSAWRKEKPQALQEIAAPYLK
ncbi:MAG: nitrite/sulfite reductase [Clostridiales bacterium]|nr:nitrite/sulfite reductase [Clostridiales bacterium]